MWGLLNVSLVRDDQGEARYAIAQVEDITERKRAVQAVSQSQRQLAEAQKLARIEAAGVGHRAGVVTWSRERYRYRPRSGGRQPSFEAFLDRVHPESANGCRLLVEASIAARESFRDEYPVVRPGDAAHDRSAR